MTVFSKGNPRSQTVRACFTCGKPLAADADLFCDSDCRDQLDAGGPDVDLFGMVLGEYGFWVRCAFCGLPFDSRGLRCCCDDHERKLQAREDGTADPFDGGRP